MTLTPSKGAQEKLTLYTPSQCHNSNPQGRRTLEAMPVFVAMLKCDLENVASLTPRTSNSVWTIDVKHGQSDEMREKVTIDAEDEIEIEGSRGTANLIIKFEDAAEKAQCSILSDEQFKTKFKNKKKQLELAPRAATADDSDIWLPFLAFEARGLDVVKVHLGGDNFDLVSTAGSTFTPDLSETDWSDYDDDNQLPISITQLQTKVEVVR